MSGTTFKIRTCRRIYYNNTYHFDTICTSSIKSWHNFFYQPEIPVTKNSVLAPLTSSLGGNNRKFNLHAEKHSYILKYRIYCTVESFNFEAVIILFYS
jgi:hypothetical protein